MTSTRNDLTQIVKMFSVLPTGICWQNLMHMVLIIFDFNKRECYGTLEEDSDGCEFNPNELLVVWLILLLRGIRVEYNSMRRLLYCLAEFNNKKWIFYGLPINQCQNIINTFGTTTYVRQSFLVKIVWQCHLSSQFFQTKLPIFPLSHFPSTIHNKWWPALIPY